MKKIFTFILSALTISVIAQTQIPQGGFNNWTNSPQNDYSEPSGGWWTTLNSLVSLGAPVTVYPTSDAHSGEFAAQLETQMYGTLLLGGLLASGNFINIDPFIELGRPFTDKPTKFKGWYKYLPVDGDSAAIAARLTKFNTSTKQQDTIAQAIKIITNNVSSYTQFEIPFNYLQAETNPDSISIVFMSSAESGNFLGSTGSTLILDDISLEYPAGLHELISPELRVKAFPSPATDQLTLEFDNTQLKNLICHIYSVNGSNGDETCFECL